MAFITAFIASFMEDPNHRRAVRNGYLLKTKARADELKAQWALPARGAGMWRNVAYKVQRYAGAEAEADVE
ncbi:uncharacterized protein AMSG_10705 [Thecamonas trahens ATCC 50062]|uniref:Uncharacterized protein n=1 Tax=Thecamonas trahens ATCC 50062 TaxID=461836 RepID=A0A0L0DSW9_THETB|nr:hypothetical protein AMSG_10705 [Thecamonas trahens ATCC 50062]KNC55106.1 hypothetical protein AMSG_10705 [Thecamonas trahens ATCC 50062]|eukprot:XP_013753289.1 hypothetical protein AMSG_10705 [Thecamonas trahens ATCC 50062]